MQVKKHVLTLHKRVHDVHAVFETSMVKCRSRHIDIVLVDKIKLVSVAPDHLLCMITFCKRDQIQNKKELNNGSLLRTSK